MGKKQIAARILSMTGFSWALSVLRPIFTSEVRILAYHRILNIEDEARYPFDSQLVSATVSEFAWQMEYIRDRFTPISFQQLIDFLQSKCRLPRRPVIVTFDDGFDDNYFNAFPVLKALNIPATFFIATGYIDQEPTFWFDWLAYLILTAQVDEFSVPELKLQYKLTPDSEARRCIYYSVVEKLKRIPNQQRVAVLKSLDDRYGQQYRCLSEQICNLSKPLTWDQVREMVAHGMEFGSHTVTHPILTMLDDKELEYELRHSKEAIEKVTGQTVNVLAYPNGQKHDFDNRIRRASMRAGYRLGVSYLRGITYPNKMDSYGIKRIHPTPINDRYIFSSTLALPELFRLGS